jgi:hypothetical protein
MMRVWKVGDAELGVLAAYMLEIWDFFSGAEPHRAVALQARDTVYFIQNFQDNIEYGRLQSTLNNKQSAAELLPALRWWGWKLFLPFCATKPQGKKILRGIKVVNEEIGHLLEKGAGPSANPPQPLVADSGKEILQSVVIGRGKEMDDILQMLIQPCCKAAPEMITQPCCKAAPEMIISLVGVGGVGKTTLAQMVFNDARVGRHFHVKCWVTVSTSSSKVELTAEILRSAQPAWDGSPEKMLDFQMILSELRRYVASKMCLIVIDDVCNSTDGFLLDILTALQSADTGSRILATSRINTVPHVLGASQMYTINPLSSDDCWALQIFS